MPWLRYAELAPAAAHARHVLTYWRFEARLAPGETFLHHVWPDGCVSLALSIGEPPAHGRPAAAIAGPVLQARQIPLEGARVDYVGVRFWPDTGAAMLGVPAAELRDAGFPAARWLGERASEWVAQVASAVAQDGDAGAVKVLDALLAPRVADATEPDARVRRAVDAAVRARGDLPIARMADAAGLSERQLQRRFRALVGLAPKEYARIRRVRSAIGMLLEQRVRWSEVAAEFGYADQAHLIRDVSEVTGFTPVALEARVAAIEHESVRP